MAPDTPLTSSCLLVFAADFEVEGVGVEQKGDYGEEEDAGQGEDEEKLQAGVGALLRGSLGRVHAQAGHLIFVVRAHSGVPVS
eukprot:CAMPEP_0173310700 /NCGR_PEP_ID=MMETSP1143-20121109/23078_1 /TAXON_ID=483371 /ORGANISM="non described non described, Strain CCMP2298" /LENGTH=82 /DNA_ID=CAMNT_0014252525 /DNA_START=217 /DNA_END=464 /DNA_ORIENTATION=+